MLLDTTPRQPSCQLSEECMRMSYCQQPIAINNSYVPLDLHLSPRSGVFHPQH